MSNDFKNSREHALKKGDNILPREYMELKGIFAIEHFCPLLESSSNV